MTQLVPPYQADKLYPLLVNNNQEYLHYAKTLPSIMLNPLQQGDLFMLGLGAFTPLMGFMGRDDWYSVCENMTLSNGIVWPIPITLSVSRTVATSIALNSDIALTDFKKNILAILHCQEIYDNNHDLEAKYVFATHDQKHPGISLLHTQGEVNLAGKVDVLSLGEFPQKFPKLLLSPQQTRDLFVKKKWRTIAALQTRNPMHRAHEHIAKLALQQCDGLFIHSILGQLKTDDIPAEIATKVITQLTTHYFKQDSVLQAGYPMSMRYAGPREALLHAIFRQNYGCSHLIIGRDHAGVNNYYEPYAAQDIFRQIPKEALTIKPLYVDTAFWCYRCDGMATERDCPHELSDRLLISGTQLRELLRKQSPIPEHFSRDVVLTVLRDFYRD